jgi:hypothetical protein
MQGRWPSRTRAATLRPAPSTVSAPCVAQRLAACEAYLPDTPSPHCGLLVRLMPAARAIAVIRVILSSGGGASPGPKPHCGPDDLGDGRDGFAGGEPQRGESVSAVPGVERSQRVNLQPPLTQLGITTRSAQSASGLILDVSWRCEPRPERQQPKIAHQPSVAARSTRMGVSAFLPPRSQSPRCGDCPLWQRPRRNAA